MPVGRRQVQGGNMLLIDAVNEVGDYQRVRVRLASGTHAWAYINGQA